MNKPGSISAANALWVRALVREKAGISLEDDRDYLFAARLRSIATELGFVNEEQMINVLRAKPDLEPPRWKIVEALTTNETSFFRDRAVYQGLQGSILPELAEKRRAQKRLTIWCAAASTGQEPYSVAMICREMADKLGNPKIRIVGTDINHEVLQKARSAVYTEIEVGRGMPRELLTKYFRPRTGGWIVADELRSMVELHRMNLVETWLPIRADLILLRNVLYYLDERAKRHVLDQALRALAPDGYLALGSTETVVGVHDGFEPIRRDGATFFRPKANSKTLGTQAETRLSASERPERQELRTPISVARPTALPPAADRRPKTSPISTAKLEQLAANARELRSRTTGKLGSKREAIEHARQSVPLPPRPVASTPVRPALVSHTSAARRKG